MKQTLPVMAVLPLVVGYGLFEGLWSGRWLPAEAVDRAAEKLQGLPREVGDWEGTDEQPDFRTLERAGVRGHVMRQYVHRTTGKRVSVLLVCGPPGPTSAHAPAICLGGSGYRQLAAEARRDVPDGSAAATAQFWTAPFCKDGVVPETLRVFWSWNAEGDWLAVDYPRLQFAPYAVLYKLYVIREEAEAAGSADDPALQFLAVFLPQARRSLFAGAAALGP